MYCGPQGPQASGREWRLRFHKRHGFHRQTCPTNVLLAMHHILRTWAAERLAAPLPTHGGQKDLKADPRQFFINSLQTKAWIPQLYLLQARCNHNELVERTAALRDLELLVGSGGLDLDFAKGMDSLDKHVEKSPFGSVTFCEHGQLKGWQPHFQATVAKSSISTIVGWFAAVSYHN